jgi:hypothetical protein
VVPDRRVGQPGEIRDAVPTSSVGWPSRILTHPAMRTHRAFIEQKPRRRHMRGVAATDSSRQGGDVTLFDRWRR